MGITKRCTEPQGEASLFQAFAVEQVEHSDSLCVEQRS